MKLKTNSLNKINIQFHICLITESFISMFKGIKYRNHRKEFLNYQKSDLYAKLQS